MIVLDIQRRLVALGYDLGRSGPNKDGVDGDLGDLSQSAILSALETGKRAPARPIAVPAPGPEPHEIPAAWMPEARMSRIIVHWTAGGHAATAFDREHYHILIDGSGEIVRGKPSIALNDASGVKSGYAAHTLSCNTGSIGVSLCCMAGAVETPFSAGKSPMTPEQWAALPGVLADLCRRYAIPVTPRTVLSHAEVQGTLGIAQRGKWDIAAVPAGGVGGMVKLGATSAGNGFRAATAALLAT